MNNKVCKEYIREIKTVFPVKNKQEREYIKNLSNDIADFCEQEGITSKEELYNNYGSPIDVFSNGDSLCCQENKDRQIHQKTYCGCTYSCTHINCYILHCFA